MNIPEAQNDKLIDLLMKKSDQFIPNIALYFERDELLIRNFNPPIINSAKHIPDSQPSPESPKFDAFDITPARNVRKGQIINSWDFALANFRAKTSRTWFTFARELDGQERQFWFIYLNGQFYFYFPDTGFATSCYTTGMMTIKGLIISYTLEDNSVRKFSAISKNPTTGALGGKDSEFQKFLINAFQAKSQQPFEDFFRSFLARVGYPKVSENTLSLYRYHFENPSMLYILANENVRTETQKNYVNAWIHAADTNLVHILKVWFFQYFLNHDLSNAFTQRCFMFEILTKVFMDDPGFSQFANEYKQNHDVSLFTKAEFGGLIKYIIYVVFNAMSHNDMTGHDKSILMLKFIFEIILCDETIKDHFQDQSLLVYFTQNYDVEPEFEMQISESISQEEAQQFLDEITNNIDIYVQHVSTTRAANQIESYNNIINPISLRSRKLTTSDSFRIRSPSNSSSKQLEGVYQNNNGVFDSFPVLASGPQSLPPKKSSFMPPSGLESDTILSTPVPNRIGMEPSPLSPGGMGIPSYGSLGSLPPPSLLLAPPAYPESPERPKPTEDDFSVPPFIAPPAQSDEDEDEDEKPVVDEKFEEKPKQESLSSSYSDYSDYSSSDSEEIVIDLNARYPSYCYYRTNRPTTRPLLRGDFVRQLLKEKKKHEREARRAERKQRKEEEKKKKESKAEDDDEPEATLMRAPNYDGTEEPPMESEPDSSESDVTIQNA